MKYCYERAGTVIELDVELTEHGCVVRGPDGAPQRVELLTRADGSQRATTPWGDIELMSARHNQEVWVDMRGRRLNARVLRARPLGAALAGDAAKGAVLTPMAGKLLRLDVRVGDRVRVGQPVAVIEAMKMENELTAPLDGVVVEVGPTAPATVEKGALLARIEPT